jgi:hypothetical protein
MFKVIFALFVSIILVGQTTHHALADETFTGGVNLPGASMSQDVTYHPSRSEYLSVRNKTFDLLKAKKSSANVNPADGPWMLVETTATIGLEYHGVGVSSGRKHVRKVSAAEEALYMLEHKIEPKR